MVDELVARTQVPEIKEPVLAVVSPHAGYPYSGPVAAYSYAVLKGRKFARVVVISLRRLFLCVGLPRRRLCDVAGQYPAR